MLQHCYPALTEKWEVQTHHRGRQGGRLWLQSYSSDVSAPFNIITLINKQSCFPGQTALDRKQEEGSETIIFYADVTQRWRV